MSEFVISDLICGYTINVFDEPKRVSNHHSQLSFPMRITHSPIYFVVKLNNNAVAFRGTLSPINIKSGNARNRAIEDAILEWSMKYVDLVERKYKEKVEKVCDGSCNSRVCLSKPPPE